MSSILAQVTEALPDIEIGEELGAGGLGRVWAGTQRSSRDKVAIKVVEPPHPPGEVPAWAERFRREVAALQRIEHPNVVRIRGHGELPDGARFIVMDRVVGPSAAELIAAGPSPPHRALALVEEVCAGLEYAHALGILHRDVSPRNVLLCPLDGAKLIDFGLAKSSGEVSVTVTGTVVGTRGVIPPEVRRGDRTARPQIDVWAVGVLLEWLLRGRQGELPPLAPEMELILAGALALDPLDRTPSMAALRFQVAIARREARRLLPGPPKRPSLWTRIRRKLAK